MVPGVLIDSLLIQRTGPMNCCMRLRGISKVTLAYGWQSMALKFNVVPLTARIWSVRVVVF